MKFLNENGVLYLVQRFKTWLIGKADATHTHNKSDINGYSDYELPTASANTKGGFKVGAGLVMNGEVLSASGGGTADSVDWSNVQNKPTIPTNNNQLTNGAGYQTASQVQSLINQSITTVMKYKGTVANYSNLPSNAEVGDVYNITNKSANNNAGDNAAWNGTSWDILAGTVDLSGYVEESDLEAITNAEIDTICNS